MEHEGDGDTDCSWCTRSSLQRRRKWNGGIKNQRKNRDDKDPIIVKIGQNTEKSPGDLRRLVVTQTPVKDP